MFAGDQWHLRKTNWCGESGEVIDDLDLTLDQCQLKDGDLLLIEEGQLPPKVCRIVINKLGSL